MSSADDLVHRLAAKMTSADHDGPPSAAPAVVDLTAEDGADPVEGDDVVIQVIDLDTYEAAHQLAVDVEQRS